MGGAGCLVYRGGGDGCLVYRVGDAGCLVHRMGGVGCLYTGCSRCSVIIFTPDIKWSIY